MRSLRRTLAGLLGLIALAVGFAASAQQGPIITTFFAVTTTGIAVSVPLSGGQGYCAVSLTSAGTGLTMVPQASNDGGKTWVTATSINNGSITAVGNYSGSVVTYGVTTFSLAVTALTSGTVAGTVSCTTAGVGGGGGASGNVTVTNFTSPIPLPVSISSPVANGVVQVNTPAPAPTISPGLQIGVTLACPSTSPAAINNTYVCVNDSTGRLAVSTPAPFTHLATANPTSSPTAVKASAGTLGMVRFYNGSASTQFIGIYDLATSSVTLGTTVATEVLQCPATTLCFLPITAPGITFSTAITYLCGTAITTGAVGTACGSNTSSFLMFDYQYAAWRREHDTHLRIAPRWTVGDSGWAPRLRDP